MAATLSLLALLAAAADLPAGRPPVRTYTLQQGLASDRVLGLLQDSRGFLWIGTDSGLSRFDGRAFTTYREGRPAVLDVAEDAAGRIWFAASDGLFRFEPDGDSPIRMVEPGPWQSVVGAGDAVWAAGGDRLVSIAIGPEGALAGRQEDSLASPFAWWDDREALDLDVADDGSVWVATGWGLVRRLPDGGVVHYRATPTHRSERLFAVEIVDGVVWAVHGRALVAVRPRALADERPGDVLDLRQQVDAWLVAGDASAPDVPGTARGYGPTQGLDGLRHFADLLRRADGRLWLATTRGLASWSADEGFRTLSPPGPPPALAGRALLEDDAGNLWVGTDGAGLERHAPLRLRAWSDQDLPPRTVTVAVVDAGAEQWVVSRAPMAAARIDDDGLQFEAFPLLRPDTDGALVSIEDPGWGWGQWTVVDGAGDWWVPTGEGLLHYAPDRRTLLGHHGAASIGDPAVFRTWLDGAGALWVSTFSQGTCLFRRPPGGGAFEPMGPAQGLPEATPTAFCQQPSGSVWLGLYTGGLARWDGSRFETWRPGDAVPPGLVSGLVCAGDDEVVAGFQDGGVARLARRADGTLEVRDRLGQAEGLASDRVRAVGEDRQGRLYVGTSRGLDRVDPVTRRVEHFTRADGLAGNHVRAIQRDDEGRMWLLSLTGLSVLDPAPPRPHAVPPTRIVDLRTDGERAPVPEWGATRLAAEAEHQGGARVQIAWSAVDLVPGSTLLFQHRLVGLDERWSAPDDRTSVEYGLGTGRYRFEVRAVQAGVSGPTAAVTIGVPAPIWRRPWFVGLLGLLAGGLALGVHRIRLERALALEKQRTRIAMDLHDEIGVGLASIGLLADMAAEEPDTGWADTVAETASELGTALADIVGALRPGGSSVAALGRHLEDRGGRLFLGSDAAVLYTEIDLGARARAVTLAPAVRRNVFRIGLEALHNAARHAHAREVRLVVGARGRRWSLVVEDDGVGCDDPHPGGLGLEAMAARAREIGASLTWDSRPGDGTTVTLVFDASPRLTARW